MTDSLVLFWIGAIVVFSVIELLTIGLTTIWFAGGAVIALILAMIGLPLKLQILVFVVVSALLLIFTRPLVVKYLNTKTVKTNAQALIGQVGVVIKEIKPMDIGQVKVSGQIWTAIAENADEKIKENERVIIRQIQGVKLIVEKEKQ